VKPRRATNATRLTLVGRSQWFDWHSARAVVQPETCQRWRRRRGHRSWRGASCPGRPPSPVELQALIRQMARDNLTWGPRRLANALRLILGLQGSPRPVRKSLSTSRDGVAGPRVPWQSWCTGMLHHARYLVSSGRHGFGGAVSPGGAPPPHVGGRRALRVQPLPGCGEPSAGLAAWPAGAVEVIREDERRPPELRPPCHYVPCLGTRATPVDTRAWRPALGAGDGWHRASTRSRSAEPLNKPPSQAASGQQAA
jgi:hypothetical protein